MKMFTWKLFARWLCIQSGQSCGCNPYVSVPCMLGWWELKANTFHMLQLLKFYRLYFIIQQQSHEHFNLLILLSYNFNNFVTLEKHNIKTPWSWCRCIETCRSAYKVSDIINVYVVHFLGWIIRHIVRWTRVLYVQGLLWICLYRFFIRFY